jgi:hypothetical protein
MCIGLSACGGGGGSGGGASFDAQNAGISCEERTFLNDTVGAPAIYYNGQIPVSSQVNQDGFTTENVCVHDFEVRTITINQTNSVSAGRTTTVYSLEDTGRPTKRTTQVVNFAIQLNTFLPELRYNYDSEGLVANYTLHGVVDDQPVEQPFNTVALTWTDIAGVETSTLPATGNSPGSTFTYPFDCTTLLSVAEENFETPSSPAVIRRSTVVTSGSGRAVTTVTTPDGPGLSGRQFVFDSFGNLMQVGDETINCEPTSEQVVNIELLENALRYRGLI